MMIVKAPQLWIKPILLTGVLAVLTACGGGSGSNPPPTPPDTTPNAFTLNVVNGAEPGVEVISESITVSGINAATPISISGGEYSINSGAYISVAGTVTNGQSVTVKVTSSTELEADIRAELTIGGVTSTFIVTTLADTTPPIAQITFPPPVSMKDAATLLVRGTASDDYSNIASLTVNGVAAVSQDGFANWTAEVELDSGDNQLVVLVSDTAENTDDSAASVMVRRAAATSKFPDGNNPITNGNHLTFDKINNRILITNLASFDGVTSIIAVDLSTGIRTIFSDRDSPSTGNLFGSPQGIVIDANTERNRALVVDLGERIYTVNLADRSHTLLSDALADSEQAILSDPVNITLDPSNPDIAYISNESSSMPSVHKINLISGERTLVSDNSRPGTQFVHPRAILIDSANNRALVGDGSSTTAILFSVDLDTGERVVISDLENPQSDLPLYGARAMVSDNLAEYVLFDTGLDGIVRVNVNTGIREKFFEPFSTRAAHFMHSLYLEPGFSYLFYLDNRTQGVYAIDLESAEYVVISKSSDNN